MARQLWEYWKEQQLGQQERAAEETEQESLCTACNGSGEGQYDGTRCGTCKGKGVVYHEEA